MSLEEACANPAFPLPVGSIFPYMGLKRFIPSTFLWCNGSPVKKTDYPELYRLIGDQFQGSNIAVDGSFYLPQLASVGSASDEPVYLIPNSTLKVDAESPNAILKPTIHSSDALPSIAAANIPALTNTNFSQVYPNTQNSVQGRTLNARGDYDGSRYAATNVDGTNTPRIVRLNASSETGATSTLDSMTIEYSNPNPAAVGDIKLNADHEVRYGGMTCVYLIKAQSSYKIGGNRVAINEQSTQETNLKNANTALKNAVRSYTNAQDQENLQDAADEKAAIDSQGQGGGTEYIYEDTKQLSGFIPNPRPTY
jgi:hypothetical protein